MKSEMVQYLITSIFTSFMSQVENLVCETASLYMNYFFLNSTNSALSIIVKNSRIQLPNFCDLTNNILNCSQQTIILKVIRLIYITLKI